jgi:Na+-driven multidrug efflux pump
MYYRITISDIVHLLTHRILIRFIYTAGPFAFSVAATIRISHLLALNSPESAKSASLISLLYSFVIMSICAAVFYYLSALVAMYCTNDVDVQNRMNQLSYLAAGFQVAYGMQGSAQGVLRALGLQRELAM